MSSSDNAKIRIFSLIFIKKRNKNKYLKSVRFLVNNLQIREKYFYLGKLICFSDNILPAIPNICAPSECPTKCNNFKSKPEFNMPFRTDAN